MKKKKKINKFRCVSCNKIKPETNIRGVDYIQGEGGYPEEILFCKKCNNKTMEVRGI